MIKNNGHNLDPHILVLFTESCVKKSTANEAREQIYQPLNKMPLYRKCSSRPPLGYRRNRSVPIYQTSFPVAGCLVALIR